MVDVGWLGEGELFASFERVPRALVVRRGGAVAEGHLHGRELPAVQLQRRAEVDAERLQVAAIAWLGLG